MAVGDAHVFPGFLTPVLTQLSFQSHQLLFSHASAEVFIKSRKYTGKKVCLNRVSNSQPKGHESDTLTTEPPRCGAGRFTEYIHRVVITYDIISNLFVRTDNYQRLDNYHFSQTHYIFLIYIKTMYGFSIYLVSNFVLFVWLTKCFGI